MQRKLSTSLTLAFGLACTPSDDSVGTLGGASDTGLGTYWGTGVDDTTGSETDGGEDICFPEYPLQDGPFVLDQQDVLTEWSINPNDHCTAAAGLVDPQDMKLLQPDEEFNVLMYRPTLAASPGQWPQDRLPVAVFVPGRGLALYDDGNPAQRYYDSAIVPMVEQGFIVAAIQPATNNWTTDKRFRAQLCTLLWLQSSEPGKWSEAQNDRLNCDVVSYGHSRGGEAAILTAATFQDFSAAFPLMAKYDMRATVALAPRSDPNYASITNLLSSEPDRLVPLLTMQGGNDEDIPGQMIRAFNLWHREELTPITPVPKAALWVYDLAHVAWGGGFEPGGSQRLRAGAIMGSYIPAWLEWTVFGQDEAANRDRFTSMNAYDVTVDSFPADIQDPTLWNHIQPQYDQLDRPLVFGAYSESGASDELARLRVDMLERPGGGVPCDDLVGQAMRLTPSTEGATVELQGFNLDQVCLGSIQELSQTNQGFRENEGLRVRWGGVEPPGSIRWEVNEDVSSYAAFSLRVGQVIDDDNETFVEPLSFRVVLETPNGEAAVEVGPIVQQDLTAKAVASLAGPDTFLQTVRIPLAAFCQTFSLSFVDAVRLEVAPSPIAESQLIFDRLEFTRSPLDDVIGCG